MEMLGTGLKTVLTMANASADNAKLVGSVTEAHDEIVKEGHHALLLVLPSVDAPLDIVREGVLDIVNVDTPAKTPDHVHDGTVTVDVGGSHSVDPAVSTIELMRGIMVTLTGDVDREHKNGRGGCRVYASLVVEAEYAPPESTLYAFVTPGATASAASQLEYPHITRWPDNVDIICVAPLPVKLPIERVRTFALATDGAHQRTNEPLLSAAICTSSNSRSTAVSVT